MSDAFKSFWCKMAWERNSHSPYYKYVYHQNDFETEFHFWKWILIFQGSKTVLKKVQNFPTQEIVVRFMCVQLIWLSDITSMQHNTCFVFFQHEHTLKALLILPPETVWVKKYEAFLISELLQSDLGVLATCFSMASWVFFPTLTREWYFQTCRFI